jgi:hypothetical protein
MHALLNNMHTKVLVLKRKQISVNGALCSTQNTMVYIKYKTAEPLILTTISCFIFHQASNYGRRFNWL